MALNFPDSPIEGDVLVTSNAGGGFPRRWLYNGSQWQILSNTSLTLAAAFAKANAANFAANVANTYAVSNTQSNGYMTMRASGAVLNFQDGANLRVLVSDSAPFANVTFINSRGASNGGMGTWNIASQAIMENAGANSAAVQTLFQGSNTHLMTPLNAHQHRMGVKFWVAADPSTGFTARPSYNMTSWTDPVSGQSDSTIATDFSSANYAILVGLNQISSAWDASLSKAQFAGVTVQAAGTFTVKQNEMTDGATVWSFAAIDLTSLIVIGLGDL